MSPAVRSRVDGEIVVLRHSGRTEYETPSEVFAPLDREFHFTIDAAAIAANAKVAQFISPAEDGLLTPWGPLGSVVWLNPPYGPQIGTWIRRARQQAKEGRTVVALIPANTDTSWWHDEVMPHAEIRFLRGRVRFVGTKHKAPMGLAVVVWREAPRG